MPDDIKLPEPAFRLLKSGALIEVEPALPAFGIPDGEHRLYTADQVRAALEAERAIITEDMKSSVRWAPSSAYWSERLREFFGPDAREGINCLERQLCDAQALASRAPLTDEQIKDLCLKAAREASPDVPLYVVVSRATEAAHGIHSPKGGSDA